MVPFVARGAGTGLSGGALPVADGAVISLARMNRVLAVDLDAQRVTVQPGVTNLQVTEAVAEEGFYYAPDPSSQQVCTIGGNVAENSGGAHCLKHGFTVNHVLGLELVLTDGEAVRIDTQDEGPDVLGVFVGSEGTLGIATEITLRVLRRPEAVVTLLGAFESTDAAGAAVSGIVAGRILPSAAEMMDRLTIEAAEAAVHAGYPEGAGAVLIVELDGALVQVEEDAEAVRGICEQHGASRSEWLRTTPSEPCSGRGGIGVRRHGSSQRELLRAGRVVPRTKLPAVLRRIAELEREYGLRVGNVFHAGTETCTRSCSTTKTRRESPSARTSWPRRSSSPAWMPGARSRASTGSARTRPARCRSCSVRATWRRCSACAERSTLPVWPIRARSFRLRGCAERCRVRTVLTPWRRRGVPSVFEPASVREAADVLSTAASSGARVSLDRSGGDVVVSTKRLDRVLEHETGDLTCTVEGGVRLSALRRRLARHGQMLALDPPGDPTVGACIAADLFGPRRHRYGRIRDLLLGTTVVLSDSRSPPPEARW